MGAALRRSCQTNPTPATTAPTIDARVIAEPQPCSTPLVNDQQARPMVLMLSTAPGRSSASWVRSSGRSAATPRRTPMQAISAIGAFTSSSHSHRTWASAVPPSSGPRTKPDMPTTIITVIARMRGASSSKRRKTSEFVIGAVAAAAMPSAARRAMSSPVVLTAMTHRLSSPNTASPANSTRRRPNRSAIDPAVSSRPPKVSEYAPETHCSAVVPLPRSRPMVGSAIDSSELSTISTKNAMQRAASGIHAARKDA